MRKKISEIILLLIVFLLIFKVEKSNANVIFSIDGNKKNISSLKINNIQYIDFIQFVKFINPNLDINESKNILYSIKDTFYIVALCDNFFISSVYDNTNNSKKEIILQLSLPVICSSGIVYIPIEAFMRSLSQYVAYDYDILENSVYIQRNTFNDAFDNFFCIKNNIPSAAPISDPVENKKHVELKEELDTPKEEANKPKESTEINNLEAPPLKIKPLENYNIIFFEGPNYKYSVPDSLKKKTIEQFINYKIQN